MNFQLLACFNGAVTHIFVDMFLSFLVPDDDDDDDDACGV